MTEQEREPERVVARFRPHARALTLPSFALIGAVGGATYGALVFEELWQRLSVAGAGLLVVVLFWMLPLVRWLGTHYVVTTRRIALRGGLAVRLRQELLHSRGYDVSVRQSGLQRMFRSGDVLINTGLDRPVIMRDVPHAELVQDALSELMEASTSSIATVRRSTAALPVMRRSRDSR
jgi:uncharacterized membrane protein YdbT with pleckstrin-like domain